MQNTRRLRVSFFFFFSVQLHIALRKCSRSRTRYKRSDTSHFPGFPGAHTKARVGTLVFLSRLICAKPVARGLRGQRPLRAGAGRPFQERRGTFLRRARETMPAPALRASRAPHRLGPGHSARRPGPSPQGVRSSPVPIRPPGRLLVGSDPPSPRALQSRGPAPSPRTGTLHWECTREPAQRTVPAPLRVGARAGGAGDPE